MIRRELTTTDGSVSWLLISQVEHARVSGLLAQHWIADLSLCECDGQSLPAATSDEILGAVTHHDDGWATWEATPKIDPAHGRPYSFMNELPLSDSLRIWDGSIEVARRIGPLAGWMVAGHFIELLQNGNHAMDERAIEWLREHQTRRDAWLGEWRQVASTNAPRIAERALRLLQACDFLSLWLCCECPIAADEAARTIDPFEFHRPQENIGPYRFQACPTAAQPSSSNDPFADSGWSVGAEPWPFDAPKLELAAAAGRTPARRFASSDELVQQRSPEKLRWTLEK